VVGDEHRPNGPNLERQTATTTRPLTTIKKRNSITGPSRASSIAADADSRRGPFLMFHEVPEGKTVKNRKAGFENRFA
jgi:hypothetical protein